MDNVDEMKINSHNNEENLETKKLKCPKCGNEIAEEHAVCPMCGMDLSGKTKCSKCGSEILPGQDFCPKCGKRIKKNTESKNQSFPSCESTHSLDAVSLKGTWHTIGTVNS